MSRIREMNLFSLISVRSVYNRDMPLKENEP
jgi:hypothetical protein